ncbi:HPr kinase/phosphorylase [Gymnodinialimonas ceratoperidinii]|uniref:HPr kinase/phosphatase C-terminal domain-containing protein n=1 Tax=Gymnodinialimonas ceratoperidinii TaxID=2856823 RepID=A0A8F6YCZ3_9RHOB|nr:HPr kinase/phosphatase C-terminal domain-containing protein [Gymnodinialimonas ceratoperidinii]QXT39697.1 HPr kinase/phosphatase C-terminal domain-containing protein [Gymnodinialimonas ceratoperidinii]
MAQGSEDLAARASSQDGERLYFHASAVSVEGKGALILGPSGSGKSSLALALMSLGARLIADDGVWVEAARLQRPEAAPTLIEARGIGLLHAGPLCQSAPLALVVDLSRPEPARLPERRWGTIHGRKVELILAAGRTTLAPALCQLLRYGRADV